MLLIPICKVGQRAYHKKGHGLKIEFNLGRKKQVKGLKKAIKKGEINKTYVDKKTGKRMKANPFVELGLSMINMVNQIWRNK